MAMDGKLLEEESRPLVSVLMCAYNGLPYIKEAVSCILAQTYEHFELIISDDGSTDGTRAWLAANFSNHAKVKLFFQEKNLGYVENKNFIHRQASGQYITQLDNDDTCGTDRIEKQMEAFKANPGIKIVGCAYARIDLNGKPYNVTTLSSDSTIQQKSKPNYPFWFPSLMIERTVFEQVGYFNTYFSGALGDDIYWTFRANRHYPIYYINKPLYGYRNNPNSITNQFNNVRKLIMPIVLKKLFEQMNETGTDWLAAGDLTSLRNFETELINNRIVMAELYRIWSAKALDKRDVIGGWSLLWKAFKIYPFNVAHFRTFLYAVRTQFLLIFLPQKALNN